MSLLEDLESLDLGGILDARASIKVSVSSDGFTAAVDGQVQAALGGLGDKLSALGSLEGPQALVGPLLGAFGDLAGQLDAGEFPIAEYVDAVRSGTEMLAELLGAGGEAVLERLIAEPLRVAAEGAGDAMAGYLRIGGRELNRFGSAVAAFEGGPPTDPQQLARLAVEALVPAGAGPLLDLRGAVDGALAAAASVHLPATRTSGLVIAFDAVTAAALSADAAAVRRALRALEAARATTLLSLRADLLRCFETIDVLPLGAVAGALGTARVALRAGSEGILELLEGWREEIVEVRPLLDELDPQVVLDQLPALFAMLEDLAQAEIVDPIEAAVVALEQWLRDLLAQLPLARLRAEVAGLVHDIAARVEGADLGRLAGDARGAVRSVADALAPADLAGPVHAAIADIAGTLDGALGAIEAGLEAIAAALDVVAEQAAAVLEPAVAAIASFRAALDELTHATGSLGIERAGEEVVRRLVELRGTTEALLSIAPLPEPVRPLVEQLVGVLEGLDVEAQIGAPIRAAAAELQVPAEIGETMTQALRAASGALENVIPAQLVASIEQEIQDGLDAITTFDAATLVPGVSSFIRGAAASIRGLDPRAQLTSLGEPFDKLLEAFDALHPRLLLAPVIKAYDEQIGRIPKPPPTEGAERVAQLMERAGDATGRAIVQPALRMTGAELAPEGAAAAAASEPPPPPTVRPGDIVRVLGFVPAKLRETLQSLAGGPAAQVVTAIDGLTGGLARDLRALQGALYEIDERLRRELDVLLAPVTVAQMRAGLALRASFGAGAGGGSASIDLDASHGVLALQGPGRLRAELAPAETRARERAREHAAGLGAQPLAAAAGVLESSRLAGAGGDLDGLLAALDLEPLATEIDALAAAALARFPQLMEAIGDELEAAVERLELLIRDFNPATQAQRYLRVLGVLREQLDLLDPARLADELGEIHAAIRATLEAYDPRELAAELGAVIENVAGTLEALEPAALLGDLDPLSGIRARVEAIDPAAALAGIGVELEEVGARLAELDPGAMLDTVNELGPRVAEQLTRVIAAVRDEIVALLESLRFASGSVSVSVSVEVNA